MMLATGRDGGDDRVVGNSDDGKDPERQNMHAGDVLREIWVAHIFPFVGLGQFAFVGWVSKAMRDYYIAFYGTVCCVPGMLPEVYEAREYVRLREPMKHYHSYLGSAFRTVDTAQLFFAYSGVCVHGSEFFDLYRHVALEGNVEVMKWVVKLQEQGLIGNHTPTADVCACAVKKGHLNMLRFLHENSLSPWDSSVCRMAALFGSLDCLRYALMNGCPSDGVCLEAAYGGHVACLGYARTHGCAWDEGVCDHAASCGMNARDFLPNAPRSPSKQTLTAAIPRNLVMLAAPDHLACLQYAHENGSPWNERTCSLAAASGSLACLQYAHMQGCRWDEETCNAAVFFDRPDCLQYAHTHSCPWSQETCVIATRSVHWECLRYLHLHGCPWDENVTEVSSRGVEGLGIYELIEENLCRGRLTEYDEIDIAELEFENMYWWARKHGCPYRDGSTLDLVVDKDVCTDCVWGSDVDACRFSSLFDRSG